MNIRETVERALDGFTIENGRISEFNFAVDLVCVEIGKEIADLEAERDALRKDAERWRAFEKALRTRIPGPGHGTRIKVVEVCPMYGEEKEVSDIKAVIDAAIAAKEPK